MRGGGPIALILGRSLTYFVGMHLHTHTHTHTSFIPIYYSPHKNTNIPIIHLRIHTCNMLAHTVFMWTHVCMLMQAHRHMFPYLHAHSCSHANTCSSLVHSHGHTHSLSLTCVHAHMNTCFAHSQELPLQSHTHRSRQTWGTSFGQTFPSCLHSRSWLHYSFCQNVSNTVCVCVCVWGGGGGGEFVVWCEAGVWLL